jgi:hypothetical protein
MRKLVQHPSKSSRRGAAAVEFAVLCPILVLLIFGGIDMGQFINTGQVVSSASRVGVRKATQFETKSTAVVRDEIIDYISRHIPGLNRETIAGATTVTVKAAGTTISGATLGTIPSGTRIDVEVVFSYAAIRWFPGLNILHGRTLPATSMMRRE